ncbi:hypothetical protein [Nocardioides pinisoli]|uniref:Uncharacterized protein n=1 Tax=Nocardioides pinisoli TaxID=2950279 RepID=A0ABT1KS52_9ACTN|nr:hypothetical protein [Nocardioides pinisoli]MCP3420570.1 hypothetical protein [Nocardioides pinisoli]
MADIIVDVPAEFSGKIHIVLHDGAGTTTPDPGGGPESLGTMVARFAAYEAGPHQEVADHMKALGFEGLLPQARKGSASKTPYIRWVYKGSARTVRLYQNSKGLVSDSKKQLDFATGAPGASPVAPVHEVRFYYDAAGKNAVLEAAKAATQYANTP